MNMFSLVYKMALAFEPVIGRFSTIGNTPFFDPRCLPWTAALEARWPDIRAELEWVLRHWEHMPNFHEIDPMARAVSRNRHWKTVYMLGYGRVAPHSSRQFPETMRILERVPGLMTAAFSLLGPGKRLPPHRGPYKGLLRVHLGLLVPEPREACWIRVNQQQAHWQEGKCMVFDDSFQHDVHNQTEGRRVVLFLDVERPLPWPLSLINRAIIRLAGRTAYVRHVQNNYAQWEEAFDRQIGWSELAPVGQRVIRQPVVETAD